ncbi:sodium:solute symporter family protein [Nocardioides sp. Root151]|uniref:sodium:solute symporter family protein n=1 Tax=Nocardioides sp. Root151 TaxID=1736475 RepID=UPI0007034EBC|nr:sodium:solute symporter [Nocardioides sp. Root151]KQZ67172.1 sodium:solute symporter [Nocardioides sp. Root151]
MILLTFSLVLGLALAAGIMSRRASSADIDDYLVGGRSFGPILIFVLGAGEAYSIGTLLGFPGGVYAFGANYGVWFIAYILLAYPIGYWLAPYLWQAGKRYGAMTLPDAAGSHFRSRPLELTIAISSVIFLIPWGQLQLTGLQVAMSALGIRIDPTAAVLAGAGLTMVFLLLSGVRAPAFVSFVKDGALLLGAILVGLAAVAKSDGTTALFDKAADAGAVPSTHYTLTGSSLTFTMTTVVFQAMGFFVFPFIAQAIFAAKSEGTLKRAARFNPLYMLMYPFLVAAAFAAVVLLPHRLEGPASNQALLQLSRQVLPDWLTGLVAGGAALCAIVVLCGSALGIGSLVSRNIIRGIPAEKQRSWVRVVIFAYLIVSLVLTLELPSLLLTLVNTSYYGVTQALIVFLAMIFGWKVRPAALALGVIVGDVLVLAMFMVQEGADTPPWWAEHGLNIGFLALLVNATVVIVSRVVWPAEHPVPGLRALRPRSHSTRSPRPTAKVVEAR